MKLKKFFSKRKFPLKKLLKKNQGVIITSSLIFCAIVMLRSTGFLQFFEWLTYDWYGTRPIERVLNLPFKEPIDDRFVIVEISETDYRELQPYYPMPDATLADLLTKIQTGNPAILGLGYLSRPSCIPRT